VHTVVHLNLTTTRAQRKASDADLDCVTDPRLMAMHNLRQVIVKKQANRRAKDDKSKLFTLLEFP